MLLFEMFEIDFIIFTFNVPEKKSTLTDNELIL